MLAIADGNLHENAHLEVKREYPTTEGGRKESAKDMASFALHGGTLLIGVDEDKERRGFTATPQPLDGLGERIEQIALTRIDPPLIVRTIDIPSAADASAGYLFVEIPPSPFAPHMTGGKYYARGDRTTRVLTDAEVVELHSRRRSAESTIRGILETWSSRELLPPSSPPAHGHLFIVAEPVTQLGGGAYRAVSRASNGSRAVALATEAERVVPETFKNFYPALTNAGTWALRREGGALTTLGAGVPQIRLEREESGLVELELHDNGGFRIVMGRATFDDESATRWIFDLPTAGYLRAATAVASIISAELSYRGTWAIGVYCDRLANGVSYSLRDRGFIGRLHSFSEPTYEGVTTAHVIELEDDPFAIVERLVADLLHSLGSFETYRHARTLP